jgi:ABC-type Fe3+-siderophore transport system, permease component
MKRKRTLYTAILFLLLLASAVLSLALGSSGISLSALFSGDDWARLIILSLRLPRLLAAMLSGIAFSLSGLLLQTATGNDLASPGVIGINSGAGFMVLLFLAFFPMQYRFLPFAAFFGALLAVVLVMGTTKACSSLSDRTTLVLAGVAVSSLFSAGISAISAIKSDVLATYSSFSIGGFSGIELSDLAFPALVILPLLFISLLLSRKLTYLTLGDELAASYGISVKALRAASILLASALAAAAVSFSGLLGFVGLVVPHLAKRIYGENATSRMLGSMLLGPALVSLSDLAGRIIAPPAELPSGVFMAAIGVPFFLVLLKKGGKKA